MLTVAHIVHDCDTQPGRFVKVRFDGTRATFRVGVGSTARDWVDHVEPMPMCEGETVHIGLSGVSSDSILSLYTEQSR